MKKKSVFMGMIAISALVWMTGCAGRAVESSDIETEQEEKDGSGETETDVISIDGDKLKVMASFYPMYDFAQKIGGDRVEVTNMVPAGTEPHDWEPAASDIKKLEEADIFIYNGAGMEHWAADVLTSLDNKNLIAVEAPPPEDRRCPAKRGQRCCIRIERSLSVFRPWAADRHAPGPDAGRGTG